MVWTAAGGLFLGDVQRSTWLGTVVTFRAGDQQTVLVPSANRNCVLFDLDGVLVDSRGATVEEGLNAKDRAARSLAFELRSRIAVSNVLVRQLPTLARCVPR
jgi:hypothetical protein